MRSQCPAVLPGQDVVVHQAELQQAQALQPPQVQLVSEGQQAGVQASLPQQEQTVTAQSQLRLVQVQHGQGEGPIAGLGLGAGVKAERLLVDIKVLRGTYPSGKYRSCPTLAQRSRLLAREANCPL